MTALVNHLTEMPAWDERAKEYSEFSIEMLRYTTRKLYAEALTQLLLSKGNLTLKGQLVTYAKVIEKIVPHITIDPFYPDVIALDSVMNCRVLDFIGASKESQIKNPIAYMKSCIWSSLQEGFVKSEMVFHYHYGNATNY